MAFDSDFGLVGTGVAVLTAASQLVGLGYSVLILNPDIDFFLEDSELPFDPMWPLNESCFQPSRLRLSRAEDALSILTPDFPGSIELAHRPKKGIVDKDAPHLRTRDRLWVRPSRDLDALERYYLQADEADLNPQILEGISAVSRFPGASRRFSEEFGLLVPGLCDVDLGRYRSRLLHYVSERVGTERMIKDVTGIEIIPSGVRFRSPTGPGTAQFREGLLFFWTPKMTDWILKNLKQKQRLSPSNQFPVSARLWEEWGIQSRDPVMPTMIGVFEDMSVWAQWEGPSDQQNSRRDLVSVLNPTVGLPLEDVAREQRLSDWGSFLSFSKLDRLFVDFLKWERFTVRSLRPRILMDFMPEVSGWKIENLGIPAEVVAHCDGYITSVVQAARHSCDRILNRELGA